MRVFKTHRFAKWAAAEKLTDTVLAGAVAEIVQGLVDAELGGQVVKKRVALAGKGKRGGIRTLLAFKQGDKAFFVYGFAKSERADVSAKELRALKLLARELLSYTKPALAKAVKAGKLIEVDGNG
jgi:hypothetical protein